MPEVYPSVDRQEMVCAEIPGRPCGLVVFGGSGDLTRRKIINSIFQLFVKGLVSDKFYFLGCGDICRKMVLNPVPQQRPLSLRNCLLTTGGGRMFRFI